MRKSAIVVAAAAGFLAASVFGASAQDRFHWAGPYIGAHGEADFGNFDATATSERSRRGRTRSNSNTSDGSETGFGGGVHGGYNFEFNNQLLGIEGDWTWTDLSSSTDVGVRIPRSRGAVGANVGWDVNQYGTLRARLGHIFGSSGRTVLYMTGGVAYGDIETTVSGVQKRRRGPRGRPFSANDSQWRVGYVVGAGGEFALTQNLSFRTELLWTDFGDETLWSGRGPRRSENSISDNISFATIRAGLTFRFPTK